MDFERHVRRNPLCFGGSCPRGHISKRREGGSKRKRVEKKAVRQDSRQGRTKKRRRKRGTERERERKSGKAMQKREGEREYRRRMKRVCERAASGPSRFIKDFRLFVADPFRPRLE